MKVATMMPTMTMMTMMTMMIEMLMTTDAVMVQTYTVPGPVDRR